MRSISLRRDLGAIMPPYSRFMRHRKKHDEWRSGCKSRNIPVAIHTNSQAFDCPRMSQESVKASKIWTEFFIKTKYAGLSDHQQVTDHSQTTKIHNLRFILIICSPIQREHLPLTRVPCLIIIYVFSLSFKDNQKVRFMSKSFC